ncbi:MAG: hypothetical protein N4A72_13215 [Bacteroidales bacterium]|jgi:hypothetical protein|nr:hypothetical protein [Bacteroidales bacterium]
MYKLVWKKTISSICRINLIGDLGYVLESYTAFKSKDLLITTKAVFNNIKAEKAEILFYGNNGFAHNAKWLVEYSELVNDLQIKLDNAENGFGAIYANFKELKCIPGLELCNDDEISVGQEVVAIGAGLHNNIAINSGVISSMYIKDDDNVCLDHNLNLPNSFNGAPLINPLNNRVVGLVVNEESDTAKVYKQLLRLANDNIRTLQMVEESFEVDNVDVVQTLQVAQQQIKQLSRTLYMKSSSEKASAIDIKKIVSVGDYSNLDEVVRAKDDKVKIRFFTKKDSSLIV